MNTSKLLLSKISLLLSSLVKSNQSKEKAISNEDLQLFSHSHPTISNIESFLFHIDSTMETSAQIFLGALCLLKRLEKSNAFTLVTSQTVQSIFYTCFCIAYKYLEDEVYRDADFAEVVEIDRKKYLQLQAYYLSCLGYNATITLEELIKMDKLLFTFKSSSSSFLLSCGRLNDMFSLKFTFIQKSKNKLIKLKSFGSHNNKISKNKSFIQDFISSEKQIFIHSESVLTN